MLGIEPMAFSSDVSNWAMLQVRVTAFFVVRTNFSPSGVQVEYAAQKLTEGDSVNLMQ